MVGSVPISYSFFGFWYTYVNEYVTYSIRDISQDILQQSNSTIQAPVDNASYWATTSKASVTPITGDELHSGWQVE